jgi:demethylmenaquinone methyltransferase/2-methoxy-6-polyprenyl-1,4-benzoquinol methylase
MHRVLKPGGRVHILEFSHVEPRPLARAYDLWSFQVLPRLGQAVARDRDSYQYLAESIRRFPDQHKLAEMLGEAGFERVSWENLSTGIAAIHRGART